MTTHSSFHTGKVAITALVGNSHAGFTFNLYHKLINPHNPIKRDLEYPWTISRPTRRLRSPFCIASSRLLNSLTSITTLPRSAFTV